MRMEVGCFVEWYFDGFTKTCVELLMVHEFISTVRAKTKFPRCKSMLHPLSSST